MTLNNSALFDTDMFNKLSNQTLYSCIKMSFTTRQSKTHHHAFKLGVKLLKLGGKFLPVKKKTTIRELLQIKFSVDYSDVYLPCLAQSADSRVAHPHNDGKEGVQVLKFSTAKHKDKVKKRI